MLEIPVIISKDLKTLENFSELLESPNGFRTFLRAGCVKGFRLLEATWIC